jgi:hypothetical protein
MPKPRIFKRPRLYSVKINLSSGKIVNKMLGVAYNSAQRQKLYAEYKKYACWNFVTFHSESLEPWL